MCSWWQVVENNPCREFPRHPIGWKQSPGSWETSADFAALPMLLPTLTSLTRCRNIPGPEIIAGTRPSSEHPGFGDTRSQLPVRGADNSRLPIYPARYHPPSFLCPPPHSSLTLPLTWSMARTKQTARNSTGGKAKIKLLGNPTRTLRSHASRSRDTSRSPRVTPDVEMAEEPAPDLGVPLVTDNDTDQVSGYLPRYYRLIISPVVPSLQ